MSKRQDFALTKFRDASISFHRGAIGLFAHGAPVEITIKQLIVIHGGEFLRQLLAPRRKDRVSDELKFLIGGGALIRGIVVITDRKPIEHRQHLLHIVDRAIADVRILDLELNVAIVVPNPDRDIVDVVGEHTENFDESVTKTVMEAPLLTDERRVSMLMAQFRGNAMKQYDENIMGFSCPKYEPEQPKPITMERKDVEKMACENGGYVVSKGSVLSPEERGLRRENHRLKRVNMILMDKLCGAAVDVCMKCNCNISNDPMVKANCDMCDYAYLKDRKIPQHMVGEMLP